MRWNEMSDTATSANTPPILTPSVDRVKNHEHIGSIIDFVMLIRRKSFHARFRMTGLSSRMVDRTLPSHSSIAVIGQFLENGGYKKRMVLGKYSGLPVRLLRVIS